MSSLSSSGMATPTSSSTPSTPGDQGSHHTMVIPNWLTTESDRNPTIHVEKIETVHESNLLGLPKFSCDPSQNLNDAAKILHIHSSVPAYPEAPQESQFHCGCLSWQARRLGTAACNAAIALYKQNHPNEIEASGSWIAAQRMIVERVAAAQWAAYDAIRAKTGTVFDKPDQHGLRRPSDEYGEGHVQPWMRAKLTRAIRNASLETIAEIDRSILKLSYPSDYATFSFNSLDAPYERIDRATFPCLCKDHQVELVAYNEIHAAHYRMEMGIIPLLDEDNALERGKERASDYIHNAAQDAIACIVEKDDEDKGCKKSESSHMKKWMQWHIEWTCAKAERQFKDMMKNHPKREDFDKTSERQEAGNTMSKIKRMKALGGEEKMKAADNSDDVRGNRIGMCVGVWMPYPGCKCLLWGATEMGNEAWNDAMSSFDDDYPVACAWGTVMSEKISLTREKAVQEIGKLVSSQKLKLGSENLDQGPEDHFPEWQQDLLKERIASTVDEVTELIRANKGAPGPVAKAAAKEADEQFYQYRQERIAAEEGKENGKDSLNESLKFAIGAPGGLTGTEKALQDLEIASR